LPDTIIFGSDSNFPPYEFFDENGNPDGFNVDLIRAIAKEMGFKVKIKLGVWSEIKNEFLEKNTIHVSDMFYSRERDSVVDYAIPHEVTYDEIFIRKGQQEIFTIAELSYKKVAVQSATTMEDYLLLNHPEINIISVPGEPDALKLLSDGKCDAAIISRITSREIINKHKLDNLIRVGRPILPRELSFVVREGNQQLLRVINMGLVKVKDSGRFDEIKEKWLEPKPESWLTKNVLIVAIIFVVIVVFIFSWILGLRYLVKQRTRQLKLSNSRLKLISSAKTLRIDKLSAKEQTKEYLERVRETFNVDTCAVYIFVKEEVELLESVGVHSDFFSESFPIGKDFLKEINEDKKAHTFAGDDVFRNQKESRKNDSPDSIYKFFAVAPLITEDKITGLLGIFTSDESQEFSETDLEHLQIVSNHLAISIENNRLFRQNEKHKEILVKQIITRKKAEEEIQKFNTELEQRIIERTAQLEITNKELESFAYSVSHDLRAPLRSIDGFSQALLEDYYEQLDDQGKNYLSRVRSSAQKMALLIDDLLNLARVTRTSMNPVKVDLSAIAESITQELRENDKQRRAVFLITPDLTDRGDSTLLSIVLQNLLDNAWKFTSKKPETRIEFGTVVMGGRRTYFIRDNGAGFNMNYADKLFTPFQRLHKPDEFAGTGIGLATVQRIIHRHNGKVWAEGEVEKGVTFYFTLDS